MGEGLEHVLLQSPLASQFLELPEGAAPACPSPTETEHGVTYPQGFVAGAAACGLKLSGRLDVGVCGIVPDWRHKAGSAAVTTRNSFAAAPILLTRQSNGDDLVGVVMNSGNANACTGEKGLNAAREMRAGFARHLAVPDNRAGIASTGVIGETLDQEAVLRGIDEACGAMSPQGGGEFARSILTTDRFPKYWSLDVDLDGERVRVGGAAKGAGMIRPGMATMLAVITTDAEMEPGQAGEVLKNATAGTFNRVTVDGQMSTNDCVFLLASGASGVRVSEAGLERLQAAIDTVCRRLALLMLVDGEGARRIARIAVEGAPNGGAAEAAARAIADSPLVKTAIWGGDPNWGRVLSAAGAALPDRSFPRATLTMGGVQVVEGGMAKHLEPAEADTLAGVMEEDEIDFRLGLGAGSGCAEVFFSDLGYDYIRINAEYHT